EGGVPVGHESIAHEADSQHRKADGQAGEHKYQHDGKSNECICHFALPSPSMSPAASPLPARVIAFRMMLLMSWSTISPQPMAAMSRNGASEIFNVMVVAFCFSKTLRARRKSL